jgi:site-specific DNA-cytosine methylase
VKRHSADLVLGNFPDTHFYESIDGFAYDKMPCINPAHGHDNTQCPRSDGERPDLLVMGTPCQPFSSMRDQRNGVRPEGHDLYDVTFVEALAVLKKLTPLGVIAEQVLGFNQPRNKGVSERTYMTDFIHQVQSIKDKQGQQLYTGTKVFILSPSPWIDLSRSRTPALLMLMWSFL